MTKVKRALLLVVLLLPLPTAVSATTCTFLDLPVCALSGCTGIFFEEEFECFIFCDDDFSIICDNWSSAECRYATLSTPICPEPPPDDGGFTPSTGTGEPDGPIEDCGIDG